ALAAGDLFHALATITVTATTPVTGGNGSFFTRARSGDNDFGACQQPAGTPCATGGGQGSGVLNFPPTDTSSTSSTTTTTLPFICGNGIIDPGEQCDDGNTVSGDGCSNVCTIEAGWMSMCVVVPVCGDGLLRGGETCDDGNTVSG